MLIEFLRQRISYYVVMSDHCDVLVFSPILPQQALHLACPLPEVLPSLVDPRLQHHLKDLVESIPVRGFLVGLYNLEVLFPILLALIVDEVKITFLLHLVEVVVGVHLFLVFDLRTEVA